MPEVRLTDDAFYDSTPRLTEFNGVPAAVWIKDKSNNPFDTDSACSLYCSVMNADGWSEPRALVEDIHDLSSFEAGVIGGKACAAYVTQDYEAEENVLRTVTLDGKETTEIVRGEVYPNIQFAESESRDFLLYSFGDDIYRLSAIGSEAEVFYENAPDSCLGGFDYVTGSDGNTALVYTEEDDDESSQAYAIFMDNKTGEFGQPVMITANDSYTEQVSAAYIDGTLTVAYSDADVTISDNTVDKKCALCVSTAAQGINLLVKSIDVDYSTVISDGQITASAVIVNTGDTSTGDFDLTVKDADGNALGSTHLDGTLNSGESGRFEFSFNAPDLITNERLTLTVEDSAFSKATKEFSLAQCDLELEYRQLFFGDETVIEATVTNNNDFASPGQLQIVDENGEIVYRQDLSYLVKGDTVRVRIENPEQYADVKGRLRLRVESKADDYNLFNNSTLLVLDKIYEQYQSLLGDVDGNGIVNIIDATLIQKAAAEFIELDETQRQAADVNDDHKIDVSDATIIQKFAAEVIDHL